MDDECALMYDTYEISGINCATGSTVHIFDIQYKTNMVVTLQLWLTQQAY